MSYDVRDPYDAASWWKMQLCCDRCGTNLDYHASEHPDGSDEFWHEYGQRAKDEGWRVVEGATPTTWSVLCPICVKKKET